ncbi:MAG: hypothetical protein ACT4P1_15775 [Sporichthyaceae bacterium]
MASHDEDPVDELRAVGMTSAAALSRVAEVLIRNAQDAEARRGADQQEAADTLARRYEAQAHVADLTAADAERELRAREHAADQARAHDGSDDTAADQGHAPTTERVPEGYDSAERRARDDAAMRAAGVDAEAREAKLIADHLNGQHPHDAAKPAVHPTAAAARPGRPKTRTKRVERGR